MGMSTHAVGFVPPDENWDKMKAVYNACIEAGVDVPDNVEKFFDYNNPNNVPGFEVDLEGNAAKEWADNYRQGFEVDLSKLPENVKFIRFYNSW